MIQNFHIALKQDVSPEVLPDALISGGITSNGKSWSKQVLYLENIKFDAKTVHSMILSSFSYLTLYHHL